VERVFIDGSNLLYALARGSGTRRQGGVPRGAEGAAGGGPAGLAPAGAVIGDGVGVGVVINGELLRGKHNTAGEFGHVPLSIDGPPCACGANGCWEAYISNIATLSRYFGRSVTNRQPQAFDVADFTIEDLIIRARGNDAKAMTALHSTARYLGLGLASIINVVDPSRIYIGGEITEAWDLIESHVREAIRERTFTSDLGKISISIVPAIEYPRLRGAAALVTAPAFAAPKVA